MTSTLFPLPADRLNPRPGLRRSAANVLGGAMEAGILVLVCLSPWALGAAEPVFEMILDVGVGVLLGLWGLRMLLDGRLSWKNCPVALCLAALILGAVCQLTPLPHGLLDWISPATARMYAQFLPAQAEVLPFGETREAPVPSAGSTLSLYPGRTWHEMIRLLAVFALFAIVHNNIASPASLRRLSAAAFVNGVCLALFALLQFFTSTPNTLYWTWPSPGSVFGPFICRNHFASYMNLCIGLSVGLLLSRMKMEEGASASGRFPKHDEDSLSPARNLLHDPAGPWMIAGLAFMISSVALCVSRGGILALLSGWIVLLLVSFLRPGRFRRVGAILLTLSIALALVTWFGLGRVQARLSTLWGEEVLQDGRRDLWTRMLPLVKDFPVWGTGYGTFQYLEPLVHKDAADTAIYSNAENEYLEALLEGGLVRLIPSLLAIGLVFWLGYRAVRRHDRHGEGGLAVGLLFGFTALVVQSAVDFGLHIPAIAVLATVLCAHLCAAGHARDRTREGRRPQGASHRREQTGASSRLADRASYGEESGVFSLRLGGLAPAAGAVVAVLLGLVLAYDGWRAHKVQPLRLAASQPADRAHQIDGLTAAARRAPEYASLQIEAAQAYEVLYMKEREMGMLRAWLADAAQAVCDFAPVRTPLGAAHSALTVAPAWALTSGARIELGKVDETPLVRQYLVPAMRFYLQARDACPILPEPQRFLAEHADQFERADTSITYWDRAARLVPYDPALWYLCGVVSLEEHPDQAWKYWRRSLEVSDFYLPSILEAASARLNAREIQAQVLPEDPKILLAAALQLYPQPAAERQVFLDKALALVEKPRASMTAEDLHVKASIQLVQGRLEEGFLTYQAALEREPRQVSWRFEFAQLLLRQKRLPEARRELLNVLELQPGHPAAGELLAIVERQIAEGM
jgi:O-antigen ligase/tetratricopeptide (TPR) repeat protein